MTTSAKLLAKLAELTDLAGANYYQRISIANELMQDREWIVAECKGDDYHAAAILETKYFHDLSGSMTIWMLLTIFRKYPEESSWKAAKYNLRHLYSKCKPAPADRAAPVHIKKADFQKVEQEAKEYKFEAQKLKKEVVAKESEVETLQKRVQQLESENIRLKGRIDSLERIVAGKLAS